LVLRARARPARPDDLDFLDRPIEYIYDAGAQRRVAIIKLDDGTFTLGWEKYSDDPYEKCWVMVGGHGVRFFDTLETARQEARARLGLRSN
jgi:hypothetical protein